MPYQTRQNEKIDTEDKKLSTKEKSKYFLLSRCHSEELCTSYVGGIQEKTEGYNELKISALLTSSALLYYQNLLRNKH
jgi:hypothetical protein